METTLRLVWPQLWKLGVLLVLGAGLGMMFASAAFAQDAATTVTEDGQDFIGLLFSTTGAAISGVVALIWAAINPPPWLKAIGDFLTTKEALNWEHLLTSALDRAEAAVRAAGADAMKDRNGWITSMVFFLHQFNPEIVKYFDKNNDGVIDMLEGYMAPKGVTKGLVSLIATRLPPGAPTPKPTVGVPFPSDQPTKRRRTEAVQ